MLGLAMTGLLSLPSYVQVSAHQFPTPFNAAKAFAAPVWAPKTPSLAPSAIDDKSKGITMYAGERMDQSKKRSFIKFKSKDVQNFQQIQYFDALLYIMYISFARPIVYSSLVYSSLVYSPPVSCLLVSCQADCVRRPVRLRPPSGQVASAVRSGCVRRPIRLRPLSDGYTSTATLYKRAEKMT